MKNPWNTILEVEFDEGHKTKIVEFYNKLFLTKGKSRKEFLKNNKLEKSSLKYLKDIYNNGYGLKVLARTLDLSYSNIRTLFSSLNIEIRHGYNISTKITRKFRSDRVKGNKNPWSLIIPKNGKSIKGLQGYYKSAKNGLVWLRSSYEYVYAKWLDSKNINWKYEHKCYLLKCGERYRPDFFIYNKDNNHPEYIVEVKGMWRAFKGNRLYKTIMFIEEYPEVNLIIIDDIELYTSNLNEEVNEWKALRLLKKE